MLKSEFAARLKGDMAPNSPLRSATALAGRCRAPLRGQLMHCPPHHTLMRRAPRHFRSAAMVLFRGGHRCKVNSSRCPVSCVEQKAEQRGGGRWSVVGGQWSVVSPCCCPKIMYSGDLISTVRRPTGVLHSLFSSICTSHILIAGAANGFGSAFRGRCGP